MTRSNESDDVRPSRLELQMLRVLWGQSPLNVEQVRTRLNAEKGVRKLAYSSVITVLNILVDKGYASREKQGRAFVFAPLIEQKTVSQGFFRDLANRLFDGSSKAMMLELLGEADIDADDVREIQRLINKRKRELSE